MNKLQAKVDTRAVNDLVSEVSNHPLLKKYHIDETNVLVFYTFLAERGHCASCKGLGECPNSVKGYRSKVVMEDNHYSLEAVSCKYLDDAKKEVREKGFSKTMFMPSSSLEANLDDFKESTEERRKALKIAREFATKYKNKDNPKGLYLYGTFGTGKTYLLAAIANDLASKGISSLLVYFPDLVRDLKCSMNDNTLTEKMNYLYSVDVLMLDDFGSEVMTPWLRDEIVGPILQYRLGDKKPVFISSNLDIQELSTHLADTKAINSEKLKAARIIERLKNLLDYLSLGNTRY